jgi:hypothetical protein
MEGTGRKTEIVVTAMTTGAGWRSEEDLGKVSGGLSIARGKRNPNDQGRGY